MGQPPSDRDLKRMGRVMAGHQADKDRARWKRKVKGIAAVPKQPKKGAAKGEALDDDLDLKPDAPDDEG